MLICFTEPIFPKIRIREYSDVELVGKLAISIYRNSGWYEETFLLYNLTKYELPDVTVKSVKQNVFLASYVVFYEVEINDEDYEKLFTVVLAERILELWDDSRKEECLNPKVYEYLHVLKYLNPGLYSKVMEVVNE